MGVLNNEEMLSDCCGARYAKAGKGTKGRQRWRCTACKRRTVTSNRSDRVFSFSRLPPDVDRQIVDLLLSGCSVRETAAATGVKPDTVTTRRTIINRRDIHEPRGTPGGCHYCGADIGREKEFKRASSRLNHMFCDSLCYQNYCIATDEKSLAKYLLTKLKDQEFVMPTKKKTALRKSTSAVHTTKDLRGVLIDTIQHVQDGKMDYKQGNTIAALSKAILQSAKLDFEVVKFQKSLDADSSLSAVSLDS